MTRHIHTQPTSRSSAQTSAWEQRLQPESIMTTAEVRARTAREPRANSNGHDPGTGLVRVARGAWLDKTLWDELPPWGRALALHYAVIRTMPHDPTFCAGSAALLWHLPLLVVPRRPMVITGALGGTRRSGRPVDGKAWPLREPEVTAFDGYQLTSLTRTAVDCARELPLREALVVVDGYLRRTQGHHGPDLLMAQLEQATTRRGVRRARQVFALADGSSESVAETLTRLILVQNNLSGFVPQYQVTAQGETFRVDFAWAEEKLILEFDGDIKYSGRFGDPSQVIQAERRREKALTNAGWRVIRVNWAMLTRNPQALIDLVQEALAVRH
ncbi:endonuclease domain-containing protein [Kocuria sp.]|uniref:endonuclease domain-containing protein n=1 Tax=Kocuria sp. TaxID=1871328 RepID=UPI0026E01974|nr:DUF559 domain-containing protein [Kocuria sp.]MDO5618712.1 DUF559 domain-containing protein [Kocuria sp.]